MGAGAWFLLVRGGMAKAASRATRSPKSDRIDRLAQLVREYERGVLVEFLTKHGGSVGETAADLGLHPRGLQKKLASHGLQGFAASLRAKAGIRGPRQGPG